MKLRIVVPLVLAALGCRADHIAGPNLPSTPVASSALALGAQFSCALTTDAKPFCWGDGNSGEMGDSTFVSRLVPASTASGRSFVAIAAGVTTACALDRAGAAWCWGDDPTQPGIRLSLKSVVVQIHADRAFASIAVGRKFACALDGDGNAYCWGENGRGQLGVGDTLPRQNATRVVGGLHFTSITAGFWHACGLTAAGVAHCWGDNQFGELGIGDTVSSTIARQVSGSSVFRSLNAGSIHQCGLTAAGKAYCWGGNYSGQIGDGTATRRLTPTPSVPSLVFSSIHGGRANSVFGHTCGVVTNGDVYCWGWNSKGQLGAAGGFDDCITPAGTTTARCSYGELKVDGVSNVATLDVGQEHTCALTTVGALYCWGENAHGELGDGSGVAQASPVLVKGGLKFP